MIIQNRFNPETIEEIKYYVYSYSDPDTKIPFYIGKGLGNRCFDHINNRSESSKVEKIRELHKNKKEPIIELLRYGLTENEAYLVEATLIDYIGLDNLTNEVRGKHGRSYPRNYVDDIDLYYSAEDAIIEEDKVILISVGKSYTRGMSDEELYEYSRGVWKVNDTKHDAELALIVFRGIIREVYKILKWHEAGTLHYKHREYEEVNYPERREFEGRKSDDSTRDRYIGKSVRRYFSKRPQNPVKYVNC